MSKKKREDLEEMLERSGTVEVRPRPLPERAQAGEGEDGAERDLHAPHDATEDRRPRMRSTSASSTWPNRTYH